MLVLVFRRRLRSSQGLEWGGPWTIQNEKGHLIVWIPLILRLKTCNWTLEIGFWFRMNGHRFWPQGIVVYPVPSLEHAPAKVGWTAAVGPASWRKWKLTPLIKQGQKLWSYQRMFQISSPWEHFSCFLTSLSEMSHCKFLPLASCLLSGLWLDFWTGFCGILWPSAYSLNWISLKIPASKLQANSLQQPHNLRSKQPLFKLPSLCYSKLLTLSSTLASKRRFTTH